MAIIQRVLNLDNYFSYITTDKVIVNDLNYYNVDDLNNINDLLMTVYKDDVISTVPTCSCGATSGMYLLNKTCHSCGTTVVDPLTNYNPVLWLKSLDGVPLFINPHFWTMFKNLMAKNMDCLRWLSDTSYNPPVNIPPYLTGLLDHIGGERSYTNLVNNIDNILIYLENQPKFRTKVTLQYISDLRELYANNKNNLFSNYLPLVNKKLFVMEETNTGKFTNLAVSELIDLVITWVKATSDQKLTIKKKNNITSTVISKLSSLYSGYFSKYIATKSGIFRKSVYGTRSSGTFRAVIVATSGQLMYDEIHAPWSIGVTAFRPHILNKLEKRGYTYMQADNMLNSAVKMYDPVISEILDELIADSPYKGIPVLLQRNPTLLAGSILLMYLTKFKKKVGDKGLNIPPINLKSLNADYDGDELNVTILQDNLMHDLLLGFESHNNIPQLANPYNVSGNLNIMAPATSVLSNFIFMSQDGTGDDILSTEAKSVSVTI